MKEILNIVKYKLVGLNIFLIFISGIAVFYFPLCVPVFFILTSNLYDILGYHFTLIRRIKVMPEKVIIRSYRITQIMFDITLLIVIYVIFSPIIALSSAILKLFGVQDLLYYFFLQMKLPEQWTWLRWTPFGLFKKKFSKHIVIGQAFLGIVISSLLLIYLQR